MHHWQLTVRAEASSTSKVEEALLTFFLPLLKDDKRAVRVSLAACIHCAGEYTLMADWSEEEAVIDFEGTDGYRQGLAGIGGLLRVPPKRELWRLLA